MYEAMRSDPDKVPMRIWREVSYQQAAHWRAVKRMCEFYKQLALERKTKKKQCKVVLSGELEEPNEDQYLLAEEQWKQGSGNGYDLLMRVSMQAIDLWAEVVRHVDVIHY